MEQFDDISLVAQVAVFHNKRAFDRLVKKYQSPVRRFFLHQTLGDSELSDDLAQETFIKAYLNITKFRGLAGFSTWLFRIAYNVFYDEMRRRHPTDDLEGIDRRPDTEGAAPSRLSSNDTLRIDLYDALSRLRPIERTCITLQLIEGQPIERIVEITSLPSGTVKSHLHRAKERMALFLQQNGYR